METQIEFGVTGGVAVRVLAAALLGAIVGIQREIDDQPAGMRTHLSVSLGAALFGLISTVGFTEFDQARAETNFQVDVTRVASQVVVGIGFIGAGVIFRRGADIRNLTTAASLWVTAAIGLAAGVGDIGLAGLVTLMLFIALGLLRVPRDWVRDNVTRRRGLFDVLLSPGADADAVRALIESLPDSDAEIIGVAKSGGAVELRVEVRAARGAHVEMCLAPVVDRDDVQTVQVAPGDDTG